MIIVTGASRGLGRAVCDRLIDTGLQVFGLARNIDGLPFPAMACDVGNHDDVKAVARELRKQKANVTGLINVAGVAAMNLAVTTPQATVEKVIRINLIGTIYCCQLLAPLMLRNANGSIINFSTIAVSLGLKGESIYVASKSGVEGFSRSFAREMADFGVKVNCIAPGPIDTALLRGISSEQINKIVAQQIIQKQYTPDAVCDIVELLLDPRSTAITGEVLNVGGA
ncbi:MAG: 3-oxoacyl-ACP reductase [Proteobacteria bacterium ST_bin14]|nr:MAG: 3-oxoacyl-ACP reductase [Proteobacteria bacterium ST_bin14]